MPPTDRYELTAREVAELLAVDHSTVTRWANAGQIKCIRLPGGHRRFRRSDVEAFIEAALRAAPRPTGSVA